LPRPNVCTIQYDVVRVRSISSRVNVAHYYILVRNTTFLHKLLLIVCALANSYASCCFFVLRPPLPSADYTTLFSCSFCGINLFAYLFYFILYKLFKMDLVSCQFYIRVQLNFGLYFGLDLSLDLFYCELGVQTSFLLFLIIFFSINIAWFVHWLLPYTTTNTLLLVLFSVKHHQYYRTVLLICLHSYFIFCSNYFKSF